MSDEKLTRDQQREAARAKAKAMREAQKKSAGRKKIALISGSIVAGIALIGAVVFGIVLASQNNATTDKAPATAIFDNGIKIGKDLKVMTSTSQADPNVPNIIIYEDLQCPACKQFEIPNMPQIGELVKAGKYTLEVHPISFLDGNSQNEYSSRAGSALLCVADSSPDNFFDFNSALYNHQPEEQTAGPSNDALATLAQQTGVTNSKTLDCIKNASFARWIKNATPTGKLAGTDIQFSHTPTIIVAGQEYQGDTTNPAMFLQWLQTVAPVA